MSSHTPIVDTPAAANDADIAMLDKIHKDFLRKLHDALRAKDKASVKDRAQGVVDEMMHMISLNTQIGWGKAKEASQAKVELAQASGKIKSLEASNVTLRLELWDRQSNFQSRIDEVERRSNEKVQSLQDSWDAEEDVSARFFKLLQGSKETVDKQLSAANLELDRLKSELAEANALNQGLKEQLHKTAAENLKDFMKYRDDLLELDNKHSDELRRRDNEVDKAKADNIGLMMEMSEVQIKAKEDVKAARNASLSPPSIRDERTLGQWKARCEKERTRANKLETELETVLKLHAELRRALADRKGELTEQIKGKVEQEFWHMQLNRERLEEASRRGHERHYTSKIKDLEKEVKDLHAKLAEHDKTPVQPVQPEDADDESVTEDDEYDASGLKIAAVQAGPRRARGTDDEADVTNSHIKRAKVEASGQKPDCTSIEQA